MSTECTNLCYRSDKTCEYCKKNRIVSTEFYRARRPANNAWVIGYLVKTKDGVVEGILNKANDFHELAWIKEETLELYKENGANLTALANSEEDERPTLKEILMYRKDTDTSVIEVSKPEPDVMKEPEILYKGSIDTIPENILNMEIIAWSRKHGVYLAR